MAATLSDYEALLSHYEPFLSHYEPQSSHSKPLLSRSWRNFVMWWRFGSAVENRSNSSTPGVPMPFAPAASTACGEVTRRFMRRSVSFRTGELVNGSMMSWYDEGTRYQYIHLYIYYTLKKCLYKLYIQYI